MCAEKMKCQGCRKSFKVDLMRFVVINYENQAGEVAKMKSVPLHEACADDEVERFKAMGHDVELEDAS